MSSDPYRVLDDLDASVGIYEPDGTVVYANAATRRMFKAGDDLLGANLWHRFPDAVGAPFHQAFLRVARTGQPETFDHHYAPWDIWFRNQVYLRDGLIHVVASDITAAKVAERRLAASARASEAFSRAAQLEDVYGALAIVLAETIGDGCTVRLLDADGTQLVAVAQHHVDVAVQDVLTRIHAERLSVHEGLTAQALRTGDALLVAAVDHEAQRSALRGETARDLVVGLAARSVMAVPLRDDERIIGLASMFRDKNPTPYDTGDLDLLRDVAERASTAVARSKAFEQTERARRRADSLASASRVFVSGIHDPRAALDELARASVEAVGECAVASMLSDSGSEIERVSVHAQDAVMVDDVRSMFRERTPVAGSISERVLASGRPLRIPRVDLAAFAASTIPDRQDDVRRYAPKSFMMVPIAVGGRALGTLTVVRMASLEPYDADDEVLLDELARRAALALENARALAAERAAREAAEAARERTMRLLAVTSKLSDRMSRQEIAQAVLEEITGVLGGQSAAVWSKEDASGDLVMAASVGYPYPARVLKLSSTEHTPLGDSVTRGEPVFLPDVAAYEAAYPMSAARVRAVAPPQYATACVPLVAEGRVVGGLAFTINGRHDWTADERAFLGVVANQTAQAFDRAQLLEDERAATQAARTADRKKDEFLAMLGHELRNPLAPILTALEIMDFKGVEGGRRERDVISRQTHHLVRLVDDLLDVSRVARGKLELRKQRVGLAEVLQRAVETVSPLYEERRHRLHLDVKPDVEVHGDPARLTQIFQNLLSNAGRYSRIEGRVTARASMVEGSAVITISDEGDGIDPSLLPTIFDAFVQGPRGVDRAAGGLGLGLAIVKNLVELHEGSVTAHSPGPGRGSCFTVRLPAAEAGKDDSGPRSASPARAGAARRIVVVDDNEDAGVLLAELLQAQGHDVRVFHDASSALRDVPAFGPDVAILDIGLPEMDGYELARRLGTALPATRLVALTGYGQQQDRERATAAGFHAHAVKPIDVDRLLKLVDVGG